MKRARVRTWIALSLVVCIVGIGVWFARSESTGQPMHSGPSHVETAAIAVPNELAASSPTSSRASIEVVEPEVDAMPEARPARRVPVPEPSPPHGMRGRVVDLDGISVPNQDLYQERKPKLVLGRTRVDGTFECDVVDVNGALLAGSAAYVPVRGIPVFAAPQRPLIVVAPSVTVSGVVVDAMGTGLAGAAVTQQLTGDSWVGLPYPLESTTEMREQPQGVSTSSGSFTIEHAVRGEGTELRATLRGYESAEVRLDATSFAGVRIVLKSSIPLSMRKVTGTVARHDGTPAAFAVLQFGHVREQARSDGTFKLDLAVGTSPETALVASLADTQTTVIPNFGRTLREGTGDLSPLRIVLGPPTLSIRGRVVDDVGRPLEGCRVGLLDGTPLRVRSRDLTLEAVSASPDGGKLEVATDRNGDFEISGLMPRDYRLFARARAPFGSAESDAIRAGRTDAVIVIGADSFWFDVTGRVLAADGSPAADIDVLVDAGSSRITPGVQFGNRLTARTNSDGEFHFASIPRRFVELAVTDESIIARSFSPQEIDPSRPLKIAVQRRCHFRIEGLPTRTVPMWLEATTADGSKNAIGPEHNAQSKVPARQELRTANSRVYFVGESTTNLTIYATDGSRMDSRAVKLTPGEITTVRW